MCKKETFLFIFTRTRALLMNSSWHAFPFSFLPAHALRAEACRARPYEKVRAQGLCRGHWFMAFRLIEASSSLWPPDRKVMPVQEEHESLAMHFCRHVSEYRTELCLQSLQMCACQEYCAHPAHQGLQGAQCGAGQSQWPWQSPGCCTCVRRSVRG